MHPMERCSDHPAILGGGAINLLTGREALADDTFENVVDWHYSVCGYCSFG